MLAKYYLRILLLPAVSLFIAGAAEAQLLRTVALSGMPVPSSSQAETFSRFGGVNLNNNGDVVFYARLSGANTAPNKDTGIWLEDDNMFSTVAREGDQAPAVQAGVSFGDFSPAAASQSLFNSSGNILFPALLTGGGVTSTNNASLWAWTSGASRLLTRNGDRAPGTPDGVRYSDIQNSFSNSRLSLDEAGTIAFVASTQKDGLGPRDPGYFGINIWKDVNGSQSVIVRLGDPAPNFSPGATFGSFSNPLLTKEGSVLFRTSLGGVGGGMNDGIWLHDGVSFQPIAHEGERAPGTPAGVFYEGSFGKPTANEHGEIAFQARLRGNIGAGDYGVWSGDVNDLKLVALDRDPAPGIAGEEFDSSFGDPFSNPTINSLGGVAFAAESRLPSTSLQSMGVWETRDDSLQLVAALDSTIPSDTQLQPIPGNIAFRSILGTSLNLSPSTGSGPAMNASGQVAFGSLLMGEGIVDSNDIAIWAEDRQGKLHLVVREGDTIEVATGDFRTITTLSGGVSGGGPATGNRSNFNDLGQLAFHAVFDDGTEGVFVSNLVAIPEPPSITLLILCILGLGAARTRPLAT